MQKPIYGYWNYYDEKYGWNEARDHELDLLSPDFDHSMEKLQQVGISKEDATRLFNSGYVVELLSNVLIDRFYGGLLMSSDLRTRFSLGDAHKLLTQPPCSPVEVQKVQSIQELKLVVNEIKSKRRVVFRGQTQNYLIKREINNPYLTIKDYGEVSLLPSVWRKMFAVNPQSFTPFRSLLLLEWSKIFYSAFDLEEIERRQQALIDSGEWVYSMSDMEDCSDELLRVFGKFRMDLSMGTEHNLITTLTTLLQHYGLLSPVLDLTESLDVALFFATHRFEKFEALSKYRFVGTNDRKALLYILTYDKNEMKRHEDRDEFLKYLEPQRPVQQHCVICRSDRYSINLPAFYLHKILVLDFDLKENPSSITPANIFPGKGKDKFLKALSEKLLNKEFITLFDPDDLRDLNFPI